MPSTPRQTSGRETTPKDFAETNPRLGSSGPDFTLQTVLEVQRTLTELATKVERLMQDRKEDRQEHKEVAKEYRDEFRGFRDHDFKSLRDDVAKLRLKWAWAAGAAAIGGTTLTFVAEYVKAHWAN